MRPPSEMGVRWPKQARHTSQMVRLCMRGEELAVCPVEAPARPSAFGSRWRDGLTASPPPPRRRCWSGFKPSTYVVLSETYLKPAPVLHLTPSDCCSGCLTGALLTAIPSLSLRTTAQLLAYYWNMCAQIEQTSFCLVCWDQMMRVRDRRADGRL